MLVVMIVRRRAWPIPTILAVLCVAALVAAMLALRPSTPQVPTPTGRFAIGSSGLGDPYYPRHGNTSYDVQRYDIAVSWDPTTKRLRGTTTITAVATNDLGGFYVDLYLTPSAVRVNGQAVPFTRIDAVNVLISSGDIAANTTFTAEIDYAGRVDASCGRNSVLVNGHEVIVAGEPEAAGCWFPSNDHPSDPATYGITVQVPDDLVAVSVGAAGGRDEQGWHYEVTTPVPTYATFLAMGDFDLVQGEEGGLSYLYALSKQLPADERAQALSELRATPAVVTELTTLFGPYPGGNAVGGIVGAVKPWFGALETSGRPLYAPESVWREIIVHEFAHMWVGNHVTLRQWKDIWLNEAMASYAAWVYDERTSAFAAQTRFETMLDYGNTQPDFWRANLRDPGRERLFGLVYTRGPMAMHALRTLMGDDKFFPMWRDWAQRPGPRSVAEFIAFAESRHGSSLTAFFDAWIGGIATMPHTAEYGFR